MGRGDTCDAAMKLDHHDNIELRCELERPHRDHQAILRDYAMPGSITLMTWHENNRRNYHGEWPGQCPYEAHPLWADPGRCPLPDGHDGDHADP